MALICAGHSRYCCAQARWADSYLGFKQLIQDGQINRAMQTGDGMFECLVSKYPENMSLNELQKKLKVAQDLAGLISRCIQAGQKKRLMDIVNLDILPELAAGSMQNEPTSLLPPPEQLYWSNIETFSNGLNVRGITAVESRFLRDYYNLKIQDWIGKIVDVITKVAIAYPESSDLLDYSFVLPLLYATEGDTLWHDPHFLSKAIPMELEHFDALTNFCLFRVERPATAIAVAKYNAKSTAESFSIVDWSLTASNKCVENHRPDLAEKLLRAAIDDISDKNRIVELRLKIAENFSKFDDYATATKEYRQITKDFPGSPLYGKVMFLYFAYLAKQYKTQEILAEIDLALDLRQCQKFLPQLLYLKWWALRNTNQHALANQIGEQLIKDYRENQCIAPVLLAHATDALSSQQYDRCQKLLVELTKSFPETNSAKQAQKILNSLDNKQFIGGFTN